MAYENDPLYGVKFEGEDAPKNSLINPKKKKKRNINPIANFGAQFGSSALFNAPRLNKKAREYLDEGEEQYPASSTAAQVLGLFPGGGVSLAGKGAGKAVGWGLGKKGLGEAIEFGAKRAGESIAKVAPTTIASKGAMKLGNLAKIPAKATSPIAKGLVGTANVLTKGAIAGASDILPYSVMNEVEAHQRMLEDQGKLNPNGQPIDPKKESSNILSDLSTGAKFGVGLGTLGKGFKGITKSANWLNKKVLKSSRNYLNEAFLNTEGLGHEKLTKITRHLNPTIKEFALDIDPEDMQALYDNIEGINIKNGNLNTLWHELRHRPKDQLLVFTRLLAKRFPGVKNIDELSAKVSEFKENVGAAISAVEGGINSNLRKAGDFIDNDKIFGEISGGFKFEKYEDTIDNQYGKYKEKIDNSLRDFLYSKKQVIDKATGSSKTILTPNKITIIDVKNYIRKLKDNVDIYGNKGEPLNKEIKHRLAETFGAIDESINTQIQELNYNSKILYADNPEKLAKVGALGKYQGLLGKYTQAKRTGDIVGNPNSPLSLFQLRSTIPGTGNIVGTGISGAARQSARLGQGYLKGVEYTQNKISNIERRGQGFKELFEINPVSALLQLTDDTRVIPRMTMKQISKTTSGMDITNEYDADVFKPNIENEEDGDQSTLNLLQRQGKKKIINASNEDRAGYDVEMILSKQRVKKVINRRTPEEVKTARANREKVDLPKWKARQFEDDVTTALNPEYAVKKIWDGSITDGNVQDFKEVNPWLYHRMAYNLYTIYKNKQHKLTYTQTIALSTFLGHDLTNLKGGIFNVNKESAEPINILDREVSSKTANLKANLKKPVTEEQANVSSRYSGV